MTVRNVRRIHLIAGGRFHDVDFARLELLKLIDEIPAVRATVATSYADIESLAIADLLITYTCDIAPNDAELAALGAFVAHGGRWLALHGTNVLLDFRVDGMIGAKAGHDSFMDLIGTRFLAHPPMGMFSVGVDDPGHPLTAGIEPFEIVEQLCLLEPRAKVQTLLHSRFTGDCAPFVAADWNTDHAPVMYLNNVGTGAVLYLALGHCRGRDDPPWGGTSVNDVSRGAWRHPVYYELLRRSLRWGISGED